MSRRAAEADRARHVRAARGPERAGVTEIEPAIAQRGDRNIARRLDSFTVLHEASLDPAPAPERIAGVEVVVEVGEIGVRRIELERRFAGTERQPEAGARRSDRDFAAPQGQGPGIEPNLRGRVRKPQTVHRPFGNG
jgi:hypothetical protein